MTNQINTIDPSAISVQNNQPITNSKDVARIFNKRHADVIRKIEGLECSEDFTSANFRAHVENTGAGAVSRDLKSYQMSKDGFIFLVMGFTGKKAAGIKEAYINAFNKMAEKLQQDATKQLNAPKHPLSLLPAHDPQLANCRILVRYDEAGNLMESPLGLPDSIDIMNKAKIEANLIKALQAMLEINNAAKLNLFDPVFKQ